MTNNDLLNTTQKTNVEQHEPPKKIGMNSRVSDTLSVHLRHVT
jgi:hypothetical protein